MVKPYGKYNGMRKMGNINMYVIEICFLRLSDEIKKKKHQHLAKEKMLFNQDNAPVVQKKL